MALHICGQKNDKCELQLNHFKVSKYQLATTKQNTFYKYLFAKISKHSKCPKISYTKVFEKMAYANSADPDQTAPEGAVWSGSTLFIIPLSISKRK